MAGVGGYKGQTGIALGTAYHKNADMLFNGGVAFNSDSIMWNAGVTLRLGATNKDKTTGLENRTSLTNFEYRLKKIEEENQALHEENRKLRTEIGMLRNEIDKA